MSIMKVKPGYCSEYFRVEKGEKFHHCLFRAVIQRCATNNRGWNFLIESSKTPRYELFQDLNPLFNPMEVCNEYVQN